MARVRVPDDTLEATTRRERDAGASAPAPVPCLTIAFHPDLRRVGERAPLVAAVVAVARGEPAFAPVGAGTGSPLADGGLSRSPLTLRRRGDGVRLTAEARVGAVIDGVALDGPRDLERVDLERGVVIELADRIVLVLHLAACAAPEPPAPRMLGSSDAMNHVRREVRLVADLDVPVLVRGESGTGKEGVARAIHAASRRAGGPYLAVNLAAVTPSTAASELFGHVRGAFTGAARDHLGYFGLADGGTLFLDEIGAAPAEVQPMLLRALEAGEIQPVGAGEPRRVDVRVIAATDEDLEAAAGTGRFRAPLLYRLAGYPIVVPPLRARREDVGVLLAAFLAEELAAVGRHDLLADSAALARWLPARAWASLIAHAWPGNVRELRNVARQIAIGGRETAVARLPATLPSAPPPRAPTALDDARLIEALRRNRWEIRATAIELGVSRTWLYALIDRCPLVRPARELDHAEIEAARAACGGDVDAMAAQLEVSRRGLLMRMRELAR